MGRGRTDRYRERPRVNETAHLERCITKRCPVCSEDLEDAITFEWTSPPKEKVVVGYCRQCARIFEHSQDTGYFRSVTCAPVCGACKSEVWLDRVKSDEQHTYYRCPNHATEVWEQGPGENKWTSRVTRAEICHGS
jgi:hypothetical protein